MVASATSPILTLRPWARPVNRQKWFKSNLLPNFNAKIKFLTGRSSQDIPTANSKFHGSMPFLQTMTPFVCLDQSLWSDYKTDTTPCPVLWFGLLPSVLNIPGIWNFHKAWNNSTTENWILFPHYMSNRITYPMRLHIPSLLVQ